MKKLYLMNTDFGAGTVNFGATSTAAIDPTMAAAALVMMGIMWIVMIVLYIYIALCLYKIGKKVNAENPWFAWIPILNIILVIQIAKRPIWWIILMLIPFVNIVIGIIVMIDFLKALGKPAWWVILMMIPVVQLVIWGILAFEKK